MQQTLFTARFPIIPPGHGRGATATLHQEVGHKPFSQTCILSIWEIVKWQATRGVCVWSKVGGYQGTHVQVIWGPPDPQTKSYRKFELR